MPRRRPDGGTASPPVYIVYALVDPRDGRPHYIGRSSRGSERPGQHRLSSQQGSAAKKAWVADLHAAGLEYEVRELEASEDWHTIQIAEQRWIEHGRAQGWPLTNSTRRNVGIGAGRPASVGCAFLGCAKPIRASGWCMGHYQQARRGAVLTALRASPVNDARYTARMPAAVRRALSRAAQLAGIDEAEWLRQAIIERIERSCPEALDDMWAPGSVRALRQMANAALRRLPGGPRSAS